MFLDNEQGMWTCHHIVCVLVASFSLTSQKEQKKKMQSSGGKTRPVFGNLCLQWRTVVNTSITRLGVSLLKKYKTIPSCFLFFSFWEWWAHSQRAIKPTGVPAINVCVHVRPFLSFTFVSWNHPVISFINCLQGPQKYHLYPSFHPSASCGSLIFVRHRS